MIVIIIIQIYIMHIQRLYALSMHAYLYIVKKNKLFAISKNFTKKKYLKLGLNNQPYAYLYN